MKQLLINMLIGLLWLVGVIYRPSKKLNLKAKIQHSDLIIMVTFFS